MRTDRTFVCTDCRIRCWPVRRCPACGDADTLVDLEASPDLVRREPKTQMVPSVAGFLGVTSIASGMASLPLLAINIALAEISFLAAGGLLAASVFSAVRGTQKAVPGDRRYRVLDAPVVRAHADRMIEEGTVRARGTLTAPLSGRPCVAWRIWGEGPYGALDDAMGTVFTLALGGGEPDVEVDATVASIDLPDPRGEGRELAVKDEAMVAWLRARGTPTLEEMFFVREAIVAEGDLVQVIATVRQETRADGYRGSSTRHVLADLPGSPLIVRPASLTASPGSVRESAPNA